MALGDGTTWDESLPVDGTNAVLIDDYNRDLRKGIRNRMALEHEFPSSQSATSEGGKHKYVTLQEQASKPTLSGTQKGALYSKADHKLYFENSAGTEIVIVAGTAVGDSKILVNATDAAANFLSEKIDSNHLTISGTNLQVATNVLDYRDYGTSHSTPSTTGIRNLIMCVGIATMATGTAVITNLPFANANYGLGITRFTSGDVSQSVQVSSKSSASFKIRDSQNSTNQVQWIAVGV